MSIFYSSFNSSQSPSWVRNVESGCELNSTEVNKCTRELATRLRFHIATAITILSTQTIFEYDTEWQEHMDALSHSYFGDVWESEGWYDKYSVMKCSSQRGVSNALVLIHKACQSLRSWCDALRNVSQRPNEHRFFDATRINMGYMRDLQEIKGFLEDADEKLMLAVETVSHLSPTTHSLSKRVTAYATKFSKILLDDCGVKSAVSIEDDGLIDALTKLDEKLCQLSVVVNAPEDCFRSLKACYGDTLEEMLTRISEYAKVGLDYTSMYEHTLDAIFVFTDAVELQLQREQEADEMATRASLAAMKGIAGLRGEASKLSNLSRLFLD